MSLINASELQHCEIAAGIGVCRSHFCRMLRGKSRISWGNVVGILEFLGLNLSDVPGLLGIWASEELK